MTPSRMGTCVDNDPIELRDLLTVRNVALFVARGLSLQCSADFIHSKLLSNGKMVVKQLTSFHHVILPTMQQAEEMNVPNDFGEITDS